MMIVKENFRFYNQYMVFLIIYGGGVNKELHHWVPICILPGIESCLLLPAVHMANLLHARTHARTHARMHTGFSL